MKRVKYIVSIVLMIMFHEANGQYDFHNKASIEKFGYVGGAYFFGDIGGRQNNSILLFGYDDLDFRATKPSAGVGLRKNFNKYIALRVGMSYALFAESDAKSYSTGRQQRNLSFRTHIYEASLLSEFRVAKFNLNTKYRKSSWEYYIFGGVGGFYFNPQASYNGKYVALRPLTTEGQGLKPNTKPYSKIAVVFPVGGGLRYGYGFGNSFYIELGYRITNTDYIDDVSTSYYSKEDLLLNRGSAAVVMSYRGEDLEYPEGRERGNQLNKDSYLLINIGFSAPFKSRKPKRFHGR